MSTFNDRNEDAAASRINSWEDDLNPGSSVETYLVRCAATFSLEIDSMTEVAAARTAYHRRIASENEALNAQSEVIKLGHELIEPATDQWMDRNRYWEGRTTPYPDPTPRPPELLVHLLKSSAAGCRWLVQRWEELSAIMDERLAWAGADERKAIRLLGKTPDQEDDTEVRELRLAVCVSNKRTLPLIGELTEERIGRPVPTIDDSKVMLQRICRRAIENLNRQAAIHEERANRPEEKDRHGFDATEAGKELRRERSAKHREMLRSLETFHKIQKRLPKIKELDTTPKPSRDIKPTELAVVSPSKPRPASRSARSHRRTPVYPKKAIPAGSRKVKADSHRPESTRRERVAGKVNSQPNAQSDAWKRSDSSGARPEPPSDAWKRSDSSGARPEPPSRTPRSSPSTSGRLIEKPPSSG